MHDHSKSIGYTVTCLTVLLATLFVGHDDNRAFAQETQGRSQGCFIPLEHLGTKKASGGAYQTFVMPYEDGSYEYESVGMPEAIDPGDASARLSRMPETLWAVDDENTVAESVAIDNQNVWGAWHLNGSRLSVYGIGGDGTPSFEFPPSGADASTAVASAKGGDRIAFIERNFPGNIVRLHAFDSHSNGNPEWSVDLPALPGGLVRSRMLAVSHDGSTFAVVLPSEYLEDHDPNNPRSILFIFDGETGNLNLSKSLETSAIAVDLSDDGSLVLVTERFQGNNFATLIATATGNVLFQAEGNGAGRLHHRISGDGHVLVVGHSDLDVYKQDSFGFNYELVIHHSQPNLWFGQGTAVSRDGSTVGGFANSSPGLGLDAWAFTFDVASGELRGSLHVSGSGSCPAWFIGADANDDGSVMAFASWGTEFQEWPEVMVLNRNAELINWISFPGSAMSVNVKDSGGLVVGGAKAVHATTLGNGGRIELVKIP